MRTMKDENMLKHADLINKLRDPKEADAYFTGILERCKQLDKKEADTLLVEALRNIAQARPEDVHIDLNNESSLKMRALLRLLQFVSKKLV